MRKKAQQLDLFAAFGMEPEQKEVTKASAESAFSTGTGLCREHSGRKSTCLYQKKQTGPNQQWKKRQEVIP
jgi:hypothetical protein